MSSARRAMGLIRVGVAGWDYPDWKGTVYPSRAGAGFDRLAYLARFVDAVEINTTFYRPADPRRASSWLRRTGQRSGFRFTAKAHRSWTHEAQDPVEAVRPTLAGLHPLHEAGALGAILVQFPQSFHRTAASLSRLDRLLDLLQGWPVAVEVRHASWDDEGARERLRSRGAAVCIVDQPRIGASTLAPLPSGTARLAYMRLHGRNAADWFREDAGRDARYDYLYGEEELRPLAAMAVEAAREAAEVFVIQNNHFRGKGLADAVIMKHLVGGEFPAAPEERCAAYPVLRGRVSVLRSTLYGPDG